MGEENASPDLIVSRIAARQHGVVSGRQLYAAGLGRNAVSRRVRSGRLHRVHRGVYPVGHVGITREGEWTAAVLACWSGNPTQAGGDDDRRRAGEAPLTALHVRSSSVLAHWGATIAFRSAAVLWGLLPPEDGPIDVSVRGDGGRAKRQGIRVHRCASLLPADVTLNHGIPVTKPARTIADLRRSASSRHRPGAITASELHRAIRQAAVLGLPIGPEADAVDRTRSELERKFLRLCRRHHLPAPEANVWIGGFEVDFLWREWRLIVETDGYRYHRGRAAFEDDRDRDLRLRAQGYDTVRLSYRQIVDDPERVADVLSAALPRDLADDPLDGQMAEAAGT